MLAADGSEERLGTRTVQGGGECEWRVDTSQGGRMPHGAGSVEDLEGYRVQVRERLTNRLLLEGEVPGLPEYRGNGNAKLDQTRTEEQTQERVEDSDGDHDRDQDRDQDRTQDCDETTGDDA